MRILAGLETEYGLAIEGRGAEEQIEDSMALVRNDPNPGRSLWDYRLESPRADLRGFTVDHLAIDPRDAEYDRRHPVRASDIEIRSDRIHPNGARFYNDHGHPEYSTPECATLEALVLHDQAGELAVLRAAQAFGPNVKVYKNNTDYHGASYGTHESYLCPRAWGFDRLYAAVTPMLVARTLLTGAGKVGSEAKEKVDFQISQRADFFSEPFNVETLFRRPVFNTRDEAHADPREWIRLHVIAGDANLLPEATRRKVGLVKIALTLIHLDRVPKVKMDDPVRAFKDLSKRRFPQAVDILHAYLDAADGQVEPELQKMIADVRQALADYESDFVRFSRNVDWAAKELLFEEIGLPWDDPALRSYELAYHDVDPEAGLVGALAAEDRVDYAEPDPRWITENVEKNRAYARGLALVYPELKKATWSLLTFETPAEILEVKLDPDRDYAHLRPGLALEEFVQALTQAPKLT